MEPKKYRFGVRLPPNGQISRKPVGEHGKAARK